ncbi:predicted protein [Lichtheimia corymbifera JMRC:FSU:9682]|uniref:Uncharacterized protein n=1 Tax=Lichtheimia corymbifera JMRC:FSU:9682 TaxID=1263082 RepID=A0A068SGN9_9FUNG|nr:predicted protein [Lichtheimia corymbifera JMRC:FSU:9682]
MSSLSSQGILDKVTLINRTNQREGGRQLIPKGEGCFHSNLQRPMTQGRIHLGIPNCPSSQPNRNQKELAASRTVTTGKASSKWADKIVGFAFRHETRDCTTSSVSQPNRN